jgi:hypothetical protein
MVKIIYLKNCLVNTQFFMRFINKRNLSLFDHLYTMSFEDQEKENEKQGWIRPSFDSEQKEYLTVSGTNCQVLIRGDPVQELWVKGAADVLHSQSNLFDRQCQFDRSYPCSLEKRKSESKEKAEFRLFFPDCNYMEVWFERNNARIIPLERLTGKAELRALLMFESFEFSPLTTSTEQ